MRRASLALLVPLAACSPGPGPDIRHAPGGSADSAAPADSELGSDSDDSGEGPAPVEPWSFVVFGDNQFATTSCTSGIAEREAVPELVLSLEPDAVLHTGDLMDHGYEAGSYEQLEHCYAELFARLPFFPTSGNHDQSSSGLYSYEPYLERQLFGTNPALWDASWDGDLEHFYEDDPQDYSESFSSPSHQDDVPSGVSFETFYAVRIRDAYIISFEQGTRWWSNTPRSWLEDHLAAARSDPRVKHVFVIMHHPMYSTTMAEGGDGEAIGPVRGYYEELFRAYDVSIAFAGHAHVYEHFHVPDDGTGTRRDDSASAASYPRDGSAVHYVVTGGGGGPLPSCDPMASPREEHSAGYIQGRRCGYHVTRVSVDGERLEVEIVGVDGGAGAWTSEVWERWAIE
jgi:hypothetical protein